MALFDIYEARETINDLGYSWNFDFSADSDYSYLITYLKGEVVAWKKLEWYPYRNETLMEMSFEAACNHFLEGILA